MGIPGLLPLLKEVTHHVHIGEYRGKVAGIDAFCWLHQGAFTCCTELVMGRPTDKYIRFCMERVRLLQSHGVTPLLVFDGASIPAKRDRNVERRQSRLESRERALELHEAGQGDKARGAFQKAIIVTHEMAHGLMQALRAANVQYLVAPYEADAQLAYLSMKGTVDVVISEDSDTIPYGCRRVLFKLDKEGKGQEICRADLQACETPSFANWTDNMFLDMCLLAGCDYLPKVPGLGIKTAYKLVKQHRTYKKVIRALRQLGEVPLPDGYLEDFARARITFRHHLVFEPEEQAVVPLNPFKDAHLELDLSFLGARHPPPLAQAIAQGRINPDTHQPYSAGEQGKEEEEAPPPPARPQASQWRPQGAVAEEESGGQYQQLQPTWGAAASRQSRPASVPAAAAAAEGTEQQEEPPTLSSFSFGRPQSLYPAARAREEAAAAAHQGSRRRAATAAAAAAAASVSVSMVAVQQQGQGGEAVLLRGSASFSMLRVAAGIGRHQEAPGLSSSSSTLLPPPLPEQQQKEAVRRIAPASVFFDRDRKRGRRQQQQQQQQEEEEEGRTGRGMEGEGGEERPRMWRLADVPRQERREQEQEEEKEAAAAQSSAYFRRPHAPVPARKKHGGGGGGDGKGALERAEDALARARALEAAREEELAALAAAAAGKKRSNPALKAPMTSNAFISPYVSDDIETLHRRHKKRHHHHAGGGEVRPPPPASLQQPPPRREGEKRPSVYYPQYNPPPEQQQQEQGRRRRRQEEEQEGEGSGDGGDGGGGSYVVQPEPTGIVLDGGLGLSGVPSCGQQGREEDDAIATRGGGGGGNNRGLVDLAPFVSGGSGGGRPTYPMQLHGDGGGEGRFNGGAGFSLPDYAPQPPNVAFLSSSARKQFGAADDYDATAIAEEEASQWATGLAPPLSLQQQQHQSFRPSWSSSFPSSSSSSCHGHYPPTAPPLPAAGLPSPPPPPSMPPSSFGYHHQHGVHDENYDTSGSSPLYPPPPDGGDRYSPSLPPPLCPPVGAGFAPPFLTQRQAAGFGLPLPP